MGPESILPAGGYGFRACVLRMHPGMTKTERESRASLAVGGEHCIAAAGNAVAVLLQARQHRDIALLHIGAAEARDVARAGIVALLSESGGCEHDKRNGKKQTG